jgi:hypothetical protein
LLLCRFAQNEGMHMNRPPELLSRPISAIRQRYTAVASQSERTILLGTILLASALSGATGFVLTQYLGVDVLSSLLAWHYADCYMDWGMGIGRHCFSDYTIEASFGMRPNPWEVLPPEHQSGNNYTAAGMIPHSAFGLLGKLLGAPVLGLLGYLLALTIAVLSPAVWAARGAQGLERIVVFVACGAMAVPAWAVVDRGNSVGFVVPIALVFLVALCRQRWGLVAIMVVLAALVKPQFAVLVVVLFVARQWRSGGLALAGIAISNVAAYLLWPRDFPDTIAQSVHSVLGYGGNGSLSAFQSVSFARGFLLIPDAITILTNGTGKLPDDSLVGLRSVLGYVILVLIVVGVLALGRRIPPVMVGIVLLATAALFPAVTWRYYLVFALPVAALVVRDPDGSAGSGIFDRLATVTGRRRGIGICVSIAAALTIAQIPLPLVFQSVGAANTPMVLTTAIFTPILWLVTCVVIIFSYARRPASCASTEAPATLPSREPTSTAPS